MSTMQEIIAEDRRLAILRTLDEAPASSLNEGALHHVMTALGHAVSGGLLRADIAWLCEHGLAKKDELDLPRGKLWLAKLTGAGADVANGRSHHPGVARPDPD